MPQENSLQELADLHSEIAELARAIPEERPDARYQGRDTHHTVRVEIDAFAVVHKISIERDWRSSEVALPDAIKKAVHHAQENRFAAMARAERHPRRSAFPESAESAYLSGAEMTDRFQEVVHGLDRQTQQRMLVDLLGMLEEIDASLDHTQQRISEHLAKTHIGRTRHVRVAVTRTNEIADIEYDSRWLETAHEVNVARETQDALQLAYQRANEVSTQDIIARTPLGEFERLMREPEALRRRLGPSEHD